MRPPLTINAGSWKVNTSMPLNVLVIPDKFKGTLTARAAATAIAHGWRRARPADTAFVLPMTDGGDGFGEVMSGLLGAKPVKTLAIDAAHRPIVARWWWAPKTKTAIVETAGVVGLAKLPSKKFHPFQLDTLGLGAVLQAAAERGARHCLLGLGGSATNDGGFGFARACGWQFLDDKDKKILQWTDLGRLARIRAPRRRHWFKSVSAAVDVQNPLLGPRGAARIYGPQKGLRSNDFALAERCLRRLARVVQDQYGGKLARVPGAGAAGGLGFGLQAFLGAQLEPGFDLFAREAGIERRLRWADLVITGEGWIDESTLMGKGAGQIARRCRHSNIPCIGLAGGTAGSASVRIPFSKVCVLTELTTRAQAEARSSFWLERLAAKVAAEWVEERFSKS